MLWRVENSKWMMCFEHIKLRLKTYKKNLNNSHTHTHNSTHRERYIKIEFHFEEPGNICKFKCAISIFLI